MVEIGPLGRRLAVLIDLRRRLMCYWSHKHSAWAVYTDWTDSWQTRSDWLEVGILIGDLLDASGCC